MNTINTARVYVGTYAKYNDGNLAGKWLDLEAFSDRDAFLTACCELHKDEADPELMFQDYEGFPKAFYGESEIKSELWDWLALDEDDQELLAVYTEEIDSEGDIDKARDAFSGRFNSEEDWAAGYMEDAGMLESIPENLRNYFDYAAFARDCQMSGDVTFVRHDGEVWVFNNH